MKRIRKRRLRQVRPVWQVPGAPGRTHDAVGDWRTARLVIRGRPDGLHGYDLETGEPRWSWIAPDHRLLLAMSRTAVGGVGLAVHADENGPGEWPATCTVTAFSTDDGNVLWSVPYDFSNEPWTYDYDRFAGAIALAPDRAVVLTQGRPAAHALSSGNTVWPPIAPLKGDEQARGLRARHRPDRARRRRRHRPVPRRLRGLHPLGNQAGHRRARQGGPGAARGSPGHPLSGKGTPWGRDAAGP